MIGSRAPALVRGLSSGTSNISRHSATPGMPIDTSSYTSTGGTGADSTTLSPSLEAASRKAVSAYRSALRDIPDIRRNFTIMEDESLVKSVIRDNFERHQFVTDPKIVDMLVFKAVQELREIREQWKSRHHVYGYIDRYLDRLMREELIQRAGSPDSSNRYDHVLQTWRDRGLIPQEITSWTMFTQWRTEEDAKFRNFALENKLFSTEQLDRNAATKPSCTMM